jgi:MOSC domain-containing protein YiiM
MQLISVNVGKAQPIDAKSGMTGIYKLPQNQPVQIGRLGLEGDAIVDVENHGGVDQAVYVFGTPDYEWWSRALKHDLAPGTFGENLTITELESAVYNIGDRLRIGEALLEVTSPRIPCVTLAKRMGDPRFVVRFRKAERFGLYCRVLVPGAVQAGEVVQIERFEGDTVSALEMFRMFYAKSFDPAVLRRALNSPLHHVTRREYEALLAAFEENSS